MKKLLGTFLALLSLQSFSIEVSRQELQQIQQDLYNAQTRIQYLLNKPDQQQVYTDMVSFTSFATILNTACMDGNDDHTYMKETVAKARAKAIRLCELDNAKCDWFDVRFEKHESQAAYMIECRVIAFARPAY